MVYRVIGTMSGSSLDGLDIAFVELQQEGNKWSYSLKNSACYPYSAQWLERLKNCTSLDALGYQVLHAEYGEYMGQLINSFIEENNLQYQVQLISSHGHTTFHAPKHKMTAQLGCGAVIAATTGLNVVSDLRSMDVALGGQGAPIVPIGEKLLLGDYRYFLNLGGIANISLNQADNYIAFDVCPANRVMNMLAKKQGKEFDFGGHIGEKGKVNEHLLKVLNELEYYNMPFPKSLSNDFGTDVIYPLIHHSNSHISDEMRTYAEHICHQIKNSVEQLESSYPSAAENRTMLVTGGGAKNTFLIKRLREVLSTVNISVEVPDDQMVDYKEAIIMALIGVLRWREENNTIASVTGASRNSIGGAVWIGQEA